MESVLVMLPGIVTLSGWCSPGTPLPNRGDRED